MLGHLDWTGCVYGPLIIHEYSALQAIKYSLVFIYIWEYSIITKTMAHSYKDKVLREKKGEEFTAVLAP